MSDTKIATKESSVGSGSPIAREINLALADAVIPIPPLLALIAGYASPFVPTVTVIGTDENVQWWCSLHHTIARGGTNGTGLVAPSWRYFRFERIALSSGEVRPVCGAGGSGILNGPHSAAQFMNPHCIVANPKKASSYYASDDVTVRHWDAISGLVMPVAGTRQRGWLDGEGRKARFNVVSSMIISMDGDVLWACDFNSGRLRRIMTESRTVTTGATVPTPCQLCWDNTPGQKAAETAVWVSCGQSGLYRVDLTTNTTHRTLDTGLVDVMSTRSGTLILRFFNTPSKLHTFDPTSRACELLFVDAIAGVPEIKAPLLSRDDRVLFAICKDRVVSLSLPSFEPLPFCCDRDR